MKTPDYASPMLRPRDAAEYIGLSVASLARMRCDGSGPVFVALYSAGIGYDRADLDAWLASRPRFKSTTERTVAHTAAVV